MDARVELLTKREIELLHHVYLGRRTAEIATFEGIANQTVLNRLQEARGKLGGVDRRTAALIVAEAKGWMPGIKPTPAKNTLSAEPAVSPSKPASHGEWRGEQEDHQREGSVFVDTRVADQPGPEPRPEGGHDMLGRLSMLLVRTAFLVAATVALLWVYGRV